jgi:hypothetical protein
MRGPPERRYSGKHSEAVKKGQENVNFLATVSFFCIFFSCLMLLIIIPVALFLNCYSRFGEGQVSSNQWGVWETSRPYGDLDKVVLTSGFKASKGEIIDRKRLYLVFKDGEQWWWDLDELRLGEKCQNADEFVAFVCDAAGKPLTKVKYIEDVPGR